MLAEGQHAGIEARIVRMENGNFEGRGDPFSEHQIKHGTRSEDGKDVVTSTCYLEITEQREFAIVVYLTSPILELCPGDWNLQAWVDGRSICSLTNVTQDSPSQEEFVVREMPLKIGNKRKMGTLEFGKSATTDIANDIHLDVAESDVGTVRIQIQAGLEGARCRPYTELQRQDIGIADEAKSKKIGSVVRPTYISPVPKRSAQYIWNGRSDGKYTHEFLFKYRTKAILELLDVIPAARLPPAIQVAEPEHIDDVKAEHESAASGTRDVQQELLAQVRAMRNEMTEMKKSMNRMQAATSNKPKVVDLTGDDSD